MSITIKETTQKGQSWLPENQGQARRTFEAACTEGETADQIKAELAGEPFQIDIDTPLAVGSDYSARQISANHRGGGLWDVVVSYGIPPNGAWASFASPLNAPMGVLWEPFAEPTRTDRDADGNPFLNAAGIPYEGGQDTEILGMRLTISVNYAKYKLNQYWSYHGKVNEDAVTLAADTFLLDENITIPAECMKCVAVQPERYNAKAKYIPHAFIYEMRMVTLNGEPLAAPFDYRFANKSRIAWGIREGGSAAEKGEICNSGGRPLSQPQYLDNLGKPTDTSVTVSILGAKRPVAPAARPGAAPSGAVFETGNLFIRYKKYPRQAFAGAFPWFGVTP